MAFSTPVKAIFTGRYGSYKVSRNPFRWLGMVAFGILLIPFTVIVYPIFLLMSYVGLRRLALNGTSAEILSTGLRVYSDKEGDLGKYEWSEISGAEERFSPPVFYPAIRVSGDHWIDLQLADFHEILDACRSNGVPVSDRVNFQ